MLEGSRSPPARRCQACMGREEGHSSPCVIPVSAEEWRERRSSPLLTRPVGCRGVVALRMPGGPPGGTDRGPRAGTVITSTMLTNGGFSTCFRSLLMPIDVALLG